MTNPKTARLSSFSRQIVRVGIFLAIAIAVIVPSLTVSSASLSFRSSSNKAFNASSETAVRAASSARAFTRSQLINSNPQPLSWFPQGPAVEAVTVYESDCSTPASVFELGDQVCVKITGSPLSVGSRRLALVNSANFIVVEAVVNADGQTLTFTLPTDATTQLSPETTVDNRGRWYGISIASSDRYIRASAPFTVTDPAQPVADLSVSDAKQFEVGDSLGIAIFVSNNGPDAAANFQVTGSVPLGTTFDSVSQDSGPPLSCVTPTQGASTGTITCSIASLAKDATAELTFIYKTTGISAGTEISHTSSVSSDTNDNKPEDNSTSATTVVLAAGGGGEACVLDCPNDITVVANATQSGNPGAFVTFSSSEGFGDCGEISTTYPSGSFFPVGTTAVAVTSSEGGGSCSFNITVVTSGAPTISCPPNQTVAAGTGATEATVNPGTPTTSPSSGVSVSGQRSDNELLTSPYPVGTTQIVWTVTDSVGLSSSCTQLIVVTEEDCSGDTTAPTLTAPDDVSESTPTGTAGACGLVIGESALGSPVVSDDCVVNVTRTGVPAGNFFPVGTTTITYVATDSAGNSTTDTQVVTVTDATTPIITAPDDASYVCPSEVPAGSASQATGADIVVGGVLVPGPPSDNCGVPTVVVTDTTNGGAGSASSPLIITRTYMATDAAGNSASDTQTITVIDPTPPTISAPADLNLQCPTDIPAANPADATAADNCAAPAVTVSDSSNNGAGSTASPLVITRTFTATDAAGNTASDSQTITVVDNTVPVITCPANITVYLPLNTPDTSMAVTYPTPTATDNCGTPTVTTDIASGSVFNVGTTTVTATATDAVGNSSSCQFTVTVLYNFTGFFQPIDNLPTVNSMKAGQAAPVKFSLSGNKGLNILAVGSPSSVQVSCQSGDPVSNVEETSTAGSSSLTYDAASDQYKYVWKTESSWKNTCRVLSVTLNDGSVHTAKFTFK